MRRETTLVWSQASMELTLESFQSFSRVIFFRHLSPAMTIMFIYILIIRLQIVNPAYAKPSEDC